MSEQTTVYDLIASVEQRNRALEQVDDPPWGALAMVAIRALCGRQRHITSDEVWQELDRMGVPRPVEGRAMGPVMVRAHREGLIEPIGFTQGTNPRHHADLMRMYRVCRPWQSGS